MKKNRLLCTILAISMIVGMLPLGEIAYGAEGEVTVDKIEIYRTFKDTSDKGTYSIAITGSGLSRTQVLYMPTGGGEYQVLGTPGPGSNDYFLQFKIDPEKQISKLQIAGKPYTIDETGMPKINKVSPSTIDINSGDPQIKIEGQNLDVTSSGVKVFANTQDISNKFNAAAEVTLDSATLEKLDKGMNHIIIKRTKTGDPVETTYNYNNLFRIYEGMEIKDGDATIYPNRGTVGTEVTITIKNKKEKFSVFFLEDETKPFLYENMGTDPQYPDTTDVNRIIKIKVPKLESGKTYKVILTNNLDSYKKPGLDMSNLITKEQVVGEFYVVDASVGPQIYKVVPNQGTSAGSYVTIYGYRLDELKINGLEGNINEVTRDDVGIIKKGPDDPVKLEINYEHNDVKYNGQGVTSITRDFLVTIGRDALFEEAHIDKNQFVNGDDKLDTLYVKTKTIDEKDLKDPRKDVIVEITTTIEISAKEKYVFTEVAKLDKGYEFLPSYQDPVIEKVTPDKIEVTNGSDNNKETSNDTILSIQGKNFNVFRYKEGNDFKTNYPKVVIGGSGEDTGQIIIERKEDGKVYYGSPNDEGKIKYEDIPNAIFEVLDKSGNIVTGVGGNEVGDSIVVTIPKGRKILDKNINTSLPIAVANPKRDSNEKGLYGYKNDLIKFVTVTSSPIIEKVDPYIVTIDGGEDITIEGRNFQDGIKVFIDGKEVQNVTRDIDKQTTRGTLKFKAPKGREGENILQVMNPDGGSDTHEFIYVKTMNIDPKITSIAPNKGTKDTLVVVKGNNFLKPDQTVNDLSGLGIYKLIGTRVFLGKDDVNRYYEKDGKNALKENYEVPTIEDKRLMFIDKNLWTNKDYLKLSPYYKSAKIEDGQNIYSIYVDYEGHPVITGKNQTYTFSMANIEGKNKIIAVDSNGKEYEVTVDEEKLNLKNSESSKDFTIKFDYSLLSIGENEFGTKYLRVADYYDSLILKNNGKYYLLEVDDMGKVTLSDGKNDAYEIVLDGDSIKALQGGNSYDVEVNDDSIVINRNTFTFCTPYEIDGQTGIITGHRAKVKNKNEIWVSIPEKSIPGFYDVIVRNPDTKSYTVKNGFEYLIPQSKPKINYITPSQGSVEGGYEITIYGENFEDTSEVYISGVKIPEKDLKVNPNYKSVTVKVPKYPGDVDTDFITDKKFVPIVVVNEDGGSASREDLFCYVIASSRPRIDKINPIKGSAAGYEIVEIWGYDFRFFEPYKGEIPKDGDKNYEDIDRNGKWTNMKSHNDCTMKKPLDRIANNYKEYYSSPVLPKVYFGNNEAKIVEFNDKGYIRVVTPKSATQGAVDVYIVNNDAGTSPKIKYTYEGSNPKIDTITPSVGKRQGGEKVDVVGQNFKENYISLFNKEGEEEKKSTYLVRFGEITNRNIPREGENSGLIYGGKATIKLPGELKVEYELIQEKPTIKLYLEHNKKTYSGQYEYTGGEKFIDLKGLKDSKGNNYSGFELVKVEVVDNRVFVDRGYSPNVAFKSNTQLEVDTPTYHVIGNVNVVVENPDGISNKSVFLYKNPDSKPKIINIKRDGQDPAEAPVADSDEKILIQRVDVKGQSIITVEGTDFRNVEKVQIGNIETITEFLLDDTDPKKNTITFKMPIVEGKVNKDMLYPVIVVNDDGGTGSSAESIPEPIYIQFTSGESNPSITAIEPSNGPATGGTKVKIIGNDFRKNMEGFEGEEIKVYFGDKEVEQSNIKYIDYRTLEVTVPPSDKAGQVPVRVENPDGSLSQSKVTFTYISKPQIEDVSPTVIFTNDTETEVTITGKMFITGAKVVVGGKIIDKKDVTKDMVVLAEGILGVDSEGKNREVAVVGGEEAATVKVENDKVIKVTFKEAYDLENTSLIIINPDGGVSDPYYGFTYEKPVPSKPLKLEAIPGQESTVQLIWAESDDDILNRAAKYEIFGKLAKDKEYTFVGSTEEAQFLVKELTPSTEYIFMVRALNEYGSSIDFAQVKVRTLSISQDEKLREKEEKLKEEEKRIMEEGKEEIQQGRVIKTLGTDDMKGTIATADFSLSKYKGYDKFTLAIPISIVRKDSSVTIKDGSFMLIFNPRDLYTYEVSRKDFGNKDEYIRIHVDRAKEDHIPRGKNTASKAYNIYFDYQYGKDILSIDEFIKSSKLFIQYDSISYPNMEEVYLAAFDEEKGQYLSISRGTSGTIKESGRYILLSNR